jgi:hypothetical protein
MPHGLFDAVDCMRWWHKPGHVGVEMKPVSGGQVSLHSPVFFPRAHGRHKSLKTYDHRCIAWFLEDTTAEKLIQVCG